MRLPTRLDRYPAKMVAHLADRLVEKYALNAHRVLDPFCGSGAVLVAAKKRGIPVSGLDVNPVSELFARVKLQGFDRDKALALASRMVAAAKTRRDTFPLDWPNKGYWFTPATLEKLERMRAVALDLRLNSTREGLAVLLSFVLSVRPCSRADQRSPKPFISKQALLSRGGRHFDPYRELPRMLSEVADIYSPSRSAPASLFVRADVVNDVDISRKIGKHSHVITSPPYVNAQDYFRNFKLELYVLEGVLPFTVDSLRERFIGTERGDLLVAVPEESVEDNCKRFPPLTALKYKKPRLACVVHRYLHDVGQAFDNIITCLRPKACFVLVCGDNLVGGIRIPTWQLLGRMLEEKGFELFDQFADPIGDRMLAPRRCGHKGLIKEEVVCAFRRA